ncbi:Myosin-1 like [Actinidia chinensis var. chinensis]|uniref:Myosin-1 like n=1 Tax=Actinidia chinensis var. chinensis TaxID=1590841 RepID=A0A2R6QJW1_ACTCC|nr:Myosin-1 like [Actinidia chinensis var. chinensis]
MDAFAVDKEAVGRRENGNCRFGSNVKHRRSKSATDRNLDNPRGGISHSKQNGVNESKELPSSERTYAARSSLHKCSINTNTSTASSQRASLEKDIEQLQLCLQQEKSMRMTLERAMGRASSTLSPGHRHFSSQTKELISEIELLEEEVANREQHVLTLYRSIFDHCVSRPPSEQSSVVASPAHTKIESRKHPTIISSAFCSSKKFPLRPFQALACINDSEKRTLPLQSKTRHVSLISGKGNNQFEKTWSNHGKVQEMMPTMEKTSMLRTLKDHLCQCPCKLSEEMVRCMAAVYCWLRSSASANIEQNRSPLLSRSSTNVLPRRGFSDDRDCSYKSTVEISSISIDKTNFSRASYAINNYRFLVEQLERVNVIQMETNAKIAFWINTYNSLIMHVKIDNWLIVSFLRICSSGSIHISLLLFVQAYLAYGIPHSSLRKLALFDKWYEIILLTAMRKRSGEEKQLISSKFSLQNSVPLVCFALCTGAFSDPVLRVYTASNVKDEVELGKREFLQANVFVKKSKKVFLPKVLERFSKEASIGSDDLINWVAKNVDKKLCDSIQNCVDRKTRRKASQVIEWLPYDSKFRYVFSKDLVEKPWWV